MKKRQPSGLQNHGSNCYQNSAVQAIACCNSLIADLNDIKTKFGQENEIGNIINLIELINNVNGTVMDNYRKGSIHRYSIFNNWRKPGQQDSFELLTYTINEAYSQFRKYLESKEHIKKGDLNKWLDYPLPLRILINYEMKCGCSDVPVDTPKQMELALHVPMPKRYNKLTDLLNNYFEKDEIIGYECSSDSCDGTKATRQPRLFPNLPNTLCIHLQRSFWTGRFMKKINSEVQFEEELIIKKEYMLTEWKGEKYENNEDKKYLLRSVIVHSGDVWGGHYICYAKLDNNWYLTNDSSVSSVSWDRVRKSQPYILIYETEKRIINFCHSTESTDL